MKKDDRYIIVKNEIKIGYIKTFSDIFNIIPKSVVAKDLRITGDRFTGMIQDVSKLKVGKLFKLADLVDVEPEIIMGLVCRQRKANQS